MTGQSTLRIALAALLFLSVLLAITSSARPSQLPLVSGYVDAGRINAKTMYVTSSTFTGNHNCDDSPGSCCATGYHFCDVSEIWGRQFETTGTGRNANPYSAAWIDRRSNSNAAAGYADCSDWSTTAGSGSFQQQSGTSFSFGFWYSACSGALSVTCCQD